MKGYSSLFSNYSTSSSYSGNNCSSYSSSPLKGESQPFQEEYSVYSKMMKKDKIHGVYNANNGGYSLNPTSKKLDEVINGDYLFGKEVTISMPYVIDIYGNLVIGKRNGNGRFGIQTPHPTLIGGLDPKVKMAGMLHIKNGKISYYDDRSGHYRPNIKSMKYADEAFKKYERYMERNK